MLKAAGSRACAPSPLHPTHMSHIASHRSLCSTAPDTPLCQARFSIGSCIHERGCSSDMKASWPCGNPPSRSSIDTSIDSANGPNNSANLRSLEIAMNTHSLCIWVHKSNHPHLVLQAPRAVSMLGLMELLMYSSPVA